MYSTAKQKMNRCEIHFTVTNLGVYPPLIFISHFVCSILICVFFFPVVHLSLAILPVAPLPFYN